MPRFEESIDDLIYVVREVPLFLDAAFFEESVGEGVILILGRLKSSPNEVSTHAVKFSKSIYDEVLAIEWLEQNHASFDTMPVTEKVSKEGVTININFDFNKDEFKANLRTIEGVEIFASGIWNGITITESDLNNLVDTFDITKEHVRPFLKLGHDEKQILLQKDGLPAAGWINNLRVKGEKLIADFVDLPQKIFELIDNKSYRSVSSEIFKNVKIGERIHAKMLGAVALLGADTPAVMNLNDILANYTHKKQPLLFTDNKDKDIIHMSIQNGDENMSFEAELKAEREKNAKLVADSEKSKENYSSKLKDFEEYKAKSEAKIFAANVDKFISDLEKANLCSPAMKPFMQELFSNKDEFSVDKKVYTKEELVIDLLKLAKEAYSLNTEDQTENGQVGKNSEDTKQAEIEKYAKDNDVSHSDAYKVVMGGK